jgi:cytochrome bd-type quinol oxidase subunit 1
MVSGDVPARLMDSQQPIKMAAAEAVYRTLRPGRDGRTVARRAVMDVATLEEAAEAGLLAAVLGFSAG